MFFGGDPFEHFAGMHGGGGGGGGGRGGGRGRGGEEADTQKLYDILGVPKNASEADIKKAFKKLALKHHPDKGGDVEKFKEISGAAEILSDPEKRKVYDQYGLEGLSGEGGGGGGGSDIFDMFFGGGRRRGPQGPQKGEDLVHTIKASLEDLYNGKTVRLAISRNKPCQACEGRGGKAGAEKTCNDCHGRGVRVMMRQIGPGMVQQMQAACGECKGTGKLMDERDKCKECKGNKVFKDRKVLEVNIEKGMKHGSKIKFSGEADEVPGTLPGDVVIVVQEKEHETFKRKEADLVQTIELQLSEALCGFTRTITHLDGRVLKIQSEPGQVVKHDQVKVIQGEGMPLHGNPFTKGKMFLHFSVVFPKTLPLSAVNAIRSALPQVSVPMLSGEEEECTMTDIDLSQFGKSAGSSHRDATNDDDDDEGHGGAQRVQCGQA